MAALRTRKPPLMPNVQVILKERIKGLGAEADVVGVKRGFARNFLLPQGKAYEATKGNLRHVANLKAIRAEREAKEIAEAEKTASKIKKIKLKLTLATGQGGKAFGSITTSDVTKAIEESAKLTLAKHAVQLEKPIKSTGSFDIPVTIHSGVDCVVKLTVVPDSSEKENAEAASAE